ncbi:small GTP-binding protein, putative [Trichomonas vaginalis G3]|uniref:Small GTP-binding protein, putative n=1 Tax=Trichomonas vaginalis (strain ATCC PRA-98 / G3) TaxID=412133 RepID=A2DLV4_TRIV3|nr:GTPase protein [Trichomonas vaginalis G3]EAY18557.1 small GTP-binding protein, putative [Trichomonas vaginalis G3]KAI5491580.1 GTPase protein [Trichomonas vaginalis G3]|eukprot:XP_001579543.1 small GTP-binding protein [Trichomonas vaginalis G3]
MEEIETYTLVILGSGAVGKTSITIQLIQGRFSAYHDPTFENTYTKYVNIGGDEIKLNILDTAGQDDFECMRDTYIRQGHGFLLVFALNDMQSFDKMIEIYRRIKEIKDSYTPPVLICANKCDFPTWEVNKENFIDFCESQKLKYNFTSALTGENIVKSFEDISKMMRKQNPDSNYGKSKPKPSKDEDANCCRI